MSRNDALAAYESLPLPNTTEEHWRFTDLRGFDPDAFGHGRNQVPDVARTDDPTVSEILGRKPPWSKPDTSGTRFRTCHEWTVCARVLARR